ncbi:Solute carrier family 2, facilitated glucose transporter member 3 [Aphelenchoides bicaudatus]|nr:Solute carrier family 2, facilitated glucose transporter member 3 [Aphelenchoides bicaudatus]
MFTSTYYVSVLIVTIGASSQFYSYGIVNQEQTLVISWINQTYTRRGWHFSNEHLDTFWSFVVSSVPVGAIPGNIKTLLGALLTRTLAENFGRRNSLVYNGIFNVLAALFSFFSEYFASPELLIAGRFILGVNIGVASSLAPMYLTEITPVDFRGSVGTLHQVAVAFSEFLSLLVGLPELLGRQWSLAFSLPGLFALFLCVTLPFGVESPKYLLIRCGKTKKAKEALLRLMNKKQTNQMFKELLNEAQNSRTKSATYSELFRRQDLRLSLIISLGMMFAQQFSGCGAVFAYSTDMFLNAQLKATEAKLSTLTIGFVYFLSASMAPFIIRMVSRKLLAVFQLVSVALALTALSIFTWLQNNRHFEWAGYGAIGSLFFYMTAYGVGSSVPWIITSEIFDTRLRPVAVSVAVCTAWLLCFIVSTLYLPFQHLVGVSFSYLPFILMSTLFAILMYRLLPGKSIKGDLLKIRCLDSTVITSGTTVIKRSKRTRNDSWVSNISVL